LRLAGSDQVWRDQRHFLAAAAESMGRILIDKKREFGLVPVRFEQTFCG